MKKKILSTSVVAVLLSGVIAGCSQSVAPTQKADGKSVKGPVTISFWFPGADKANDEYFTNVAKEFENLNPNIKIETTVLPANAADVDTKLNAAKLSGTFPDVLSAYLVFMGTRGTKNEFAPLDDYLKNWNEKDDILESALAAGKVKDKSVGLAFFPAPEVLTYRKDYFQEAGLDPEKPPTTWEELAQYAEKLTKRDASGIVTRAGLDIPGINASVFFEPFLRQNGSKVIDEAKDVPSFNDPKSVEAFNFLVGMANKKVNIPYNYQKKDDVPFMNGNAAMSYLQTTSISNLLTNKPELKDKLGFAPVLKRENKVAFNGNRLFTIGANSKNKDASWEFIKFMMSKEQVWKRYKDLKIPVVRKSLEKQFMDEDPKFNSVLMDYVKNGKGKATVTWSPLYDKYIHLAYEEAISGKKPAAQALKDAQEGLEKEISTFAK
ncbi:ABC transporter substrate-binding protein [Paenibacillus radicis (ex Xue et al. 2023)]|uniref:ABC transporter substrate-binding protein n=1 Tax=Paenibacillus radicis (ex Xue et al. 2023) TaxID=2972489 RepID=A0ABT1YJ12_9BACL|nr:ABC transporter substrate-binding protein [Paenibacillus radicis (ex Xue et al. 2023)]MCR8633184.1 ABC transporter substrate-binding protein [Paenibacillus radicis (ex Xue et al. 2023)]